MVLAFSVVTRAREVAPTLLWSGSVTTPKPRDR